MKRLYNLFGAHLNPTTLRQLQSDGLEFLEEGVWVTVVFTNFISRIRKPSFPKLAGIGALGLSSSRLAGSMHNKPVVGLDFWDLDSRQIEIAILPKRCVRVRLHSDDPERGWTGTITYRFYLKNLEQFAQVYRTIEGIYKL